MRDHYQGFDHPILTGLPPVPTTDLFSEMDEIADELRSNPRHVEADDLIAFQKLQKLRGPKLDEAQWLDLRAVWTLHYRARQEAKTAETRARVAKLLEERDALFSERVSALADNRARIDAWLLEVGREIAAAFEARDGRAVATLP